MVNPKGIIPARAGSRYAIAKVDPEDRDHPRACGEQLLREGGELSLKGSSPRVRGAGIR